ncbi:MAG: hypothetical protein RIG84_12485 [Roseovarius sp.]
MGTYIAIRWAGHPSSTALLVAALMLGFALGTWVLRVLLGPKGFILALAALAVIGWRVQRAGLL